MANEANNMKPHRRTRTSAALGVFLLGNAILVGFLLTAIGRWAGLIPWGPTFSSTNLLAVACLALGSTSVLFIALLIRAARRRSGRLIFIALMLMLVTASALVFMVSFAESQGP